MNRLSLCICWLLLTLAAHAVHVVPVKASHRTPSGHGTHETVYPRVVGLKDSKVEHGINDFLKEHFERKDLDETLDSDAHDAFDITTRYQVTLLTADTLSIKMLCGWYVKGTPHPNEEDDAFTFDLSSGAWMEPFARGSAARLRRLVDPALKSRVQEGVPDSADLQKFYYLTDRAVVFFNLFDSHAIAAAEVVVPYERLMDTVAWDGPLVSLLQPVAGRVRAVPWSRKGRRGAYDGWYPEWIGGPAGLNDAFRQAAIPPDIKRDEDQVSAPDETFYKHTNFKVGVATPDLLSLAMRTFRHTNGAGSDRTWHGWTVDRRGRMYRLADLFRKGTDFKARIWGLAVKAAADRGEGHPDAAPDLATVNYYLTSDALVIVGLFSNNVSGDTEAAIPYASLVDLAAPGGPLARLAKQPPPAIVVRFP